MILPFCACNLHEVAGLHAAGDGEHASGICYLVVFYGGVQAPEIGEVAPTWPISVGEFHDQFVKLEGKWVFQSRVLRRIFRGAAPS